MKRSEPELVFISIAATWLAVLMFFVRWFLASCCLIRIAAP